MIESDYIYQNLERLAFSLIHAIKSEISSLEWAVYVKFVLIEDDQDENKQHNHFYADLQNHRADFLCGLLYDDDNKENDYLYQRCDESDINK